MRGFGVCLAILGAIAVAYGVLSSGAAPGATTLNIGLLNEKLAFVVLGSSMFVAGMVLIAAHAVLDKIDDLLRTLRAARGPMATIILVMALFVAPAAAQMPKSVTVKDSEFDKFATLVGPRRAGNPVSYRLISIIDKATGIDTQTLLIEVGLPDDQPRRFDEARTDSAERLAILRGTNTVKPCTLEEQCKIAEAAGLDLSGNALWAAGPGGIRIRVSGKSGAAVIFTLDSNTIETQVKATEAYKKKIGRD